MFSLHRKIVIKYCAQWIFIFTRYTYLWPRGLTLSSSFEIGLKLSDDLKKIFDYCIDVVGNWRVSQNCCIVPRCNCEVVNIGTHIDVHSVIISWFSFMFVFDFISEYILFLILIILLNL